MSFAHSIKKILQRQRRFLKKLKATVHYYKYNKLFKANLKRLKQKYGKEPIRVGFLGYLDGPSCDVFTDLYLEFKKDQNFLAEVVVVPYTHDFKDKMVEKQRVAVDYLNSIGIQPLLGYSETEDSYINYCDRFDIVFFEIEYDWVESVFRADNFRNALTFIIPYGQYLADNIQGHMDFKMMSEVFCIFPTSVAVRKMMCDYSTVFGKNICKQYLGNPKIDRFFKKGVPYKDVWPESSKGKKRIIWAPHHTWADYSNFLTYSNFMLDYANANNDKVFIAIKPHPALRDSLSRINKWTDKEISDYFNRWSSGSNTALFEGGWFDLFMTSDAMILDSIAFMLEYSLTGKPACVLYNLNESGQRRMKFSQCGEEVYDVLYHAKNENEITYFVDNIVMGTDFAHDERMTYIKNNYLPPYGNSGSVNIYRYVKDIISS